MKVCSDATKICHLDTPQDDEYSNCHIAKKNLTPHLLRSCRQNVPRSVVVERFLVAWSPFSFVMGHELSLCNHASRRAVLLR